MFSSDTLLEPAKALDYLKYRKISYYIYTVLVILIIILFVLLIVIKTPDNEYICSGSFNWENAYILNTNLKTKSSESSNLFVEFPCSGGGYYADYEYNTLNITIKDKLNRINQYQVHEIHKGKIMINLYNSIAGVNSLEIIINNVTLNSKVSIVTLPSDPESFTIDNFNSTVYTSELYKYKVNLFDKYNNDIIKSSPYFSCSSFFYFNYDIKNTIGTNFSYVIEDALYFLIEYKYDNYILNKRFDFSVDGNQLSNDKDYFVNILRLIDVHKTKYELHEDKSISIYLFDSNNFPINFTNNIPIYITGDKIGCNEFSQNIEVLVLKERDSHVYANIQIPDIALKCSNYFILNVSYNSNTVSYYQPIFIYNDLVKERVSTVADSAIKILNDINLIDENIYIKNVLLGLDTFFALSTEIKSDKIKYKASLYFALKHIFYNFEILYYNIEAENLTIVGDVSYLTNKFTIKKIITPVGINGIKVNVLVKRHNAEKYLTIYLDNDFNPIIPDNLENPSLIYILKDNVMDKYTFEKIYIFYLQSLIKFYHETYSSERILLDMIIGSNPKIMEDKSFITNRIKYYFGNDIYSRYNTLVAFNKIRILNIDESKNDYGYLYSALHFMTSMAFPNLIFLENIKIGVANGNFDLVTPQGKYLQIQLKDKKVYEAIGYFFENNVIISFYIYFYYSNLNIIRYTGNTQDATFVPSEPDGRKTFNIIIYPDYLKYISNSEKYLKDQFDIFRKQVEDKGENPKGDEFDLCRDNSVKNMTILIADFYGALSDDKGTIPTLKKKGFNIKKIKDEDSLSRELKDNLDSFNSIWIIPNSVERSAIPEYADYLLKAYEKGKSIFIWGDNDPFYKQSNSFLNKFFNSNEYVLQGNYPGTQKLKSGDGATIGTFDKYHPLGSGFVELYEGFTICSWNKPFPSFKTFAMQSIAQILPVTFYLDVETRILVDCGFTKLFDQYFDFNTARYVANAACWLHKLENDADTSN